MSVLIVGAFLALVAVAAVLLGRRGSEPGPAWDAYASTQPDGLAKLLGGPARAVSGSPYLRALDDSALEQLRGRLRLGGAFQGDVNVYVSYQAVALLTSAALLAVSMLTGLPTFFRLVIAGLAALIAMWPYSTVRNAASKRAAVLRKTLPDFAEVLLMVLPSMSVPQAITFTASKLDGPVSLEMSELVRTLATRSMPEPQAFDLTAERLGTPEGRAFVATLKVAYIDGARAVEPIRAQVDALRQVQFQHQRGMAKKLPVTMVVNFAVHFMPMLFILAFLPVVAALAGL